MAHIVRRYSRGSTKNKLASFSPIVAERGELVECAGQNLGICIFHYVKTHYGFKITSLYISQVKRKCGLPVGECYYHPKNPNPVIPQCPPEKEAAIRAAPRHFQMI